MRLHLMMKKRYMNKRNLDADPPAIAMFRHQRAGERKIFNAPKAHKYKELTEKIINIIYRVYNKLGYGFLEKVYPPEKLNM